MVVPGCGTWNRMAPSTAGKHAFFTGYQTNTAGLVLDHWIWGVTHLKFRNFMDLGMAYGRFWRAFDDTATRGGPAAGYAAGHILETSLESDRSKALSFTSRYKYTFADDDSERNEVSGGLNWFPKPALELSLEGRYISRYDPAQWVANVADPQDPETTHYVFGELGSEVVDISLRLDWTLRPDMTLQLYSQPFLASGGYDGFTELAEPESHRYIPIDYAENEDFNRGQFTMNLVYRWEFRPGSVLFVVWNEGRTDIGREGHARYRDLFNAPAQDVFLIKATHWFNW